MVLQSRSGFSFSVSPRLLQLELCFCSSQHTHTPSLSNLIWGGGGENTHPHSSRHATYTQRHTHMHAHTDRNKHKRTDQTSALRLKLFLLNDVDDRSTPTYLCVTHMKYKQRYCVTESAGISIQHDYRTVRIGPKTEVERSSALSQIDRKQNMNSTSLG